MSIDVVDLRNFYAQRLGVVARRFVGRGIRKRFADTRGMSVLGVGYPTPYLGLFREEAERCLAFMPVSPPSSMSSSCRLPIPPSIGYSWCMPSKWRATRTRCCAKSGGCWPGAGAC
jgi:hypothetical protein